MTTKLYIQLCRPNLCDVNIAEPLLYDITLTSPVADATRARMMIDTTEAWNQRSDYVPKRGEIIVYTDRHVIDGENYPGVKIGDGLAYVVDLPFVGEEITNQIIADLNRHITNQVMHVTQEERSYWNNKLNLELDGENLILSPIPME